ncbi:MAG: TauD/TfdA family dioxygenase [Gemmatimonadetes bacterium]|nr:TauD/TfdA family dioxygenase [Gemmatimonadota bacterium]
MKTQCPPPYRRIEVQPLSGAIGAEIRGADLSSPLDPDLLSEVRRAFLDRLVICFRDQELTPAEELAFARQMGEPIPYPQLEGLRGFPLITEVVKRENERVNFGGVWHSDTAYLESPPKASQLYAVEVPPHGGDTIFANQYIAWETLSEGLKKTLGGLAAVNISSKPEISRTRDDRLREKGETLKVLSAVHPVVRIHPESGRKALYVNRAHTVRFEGWTEGESRPLLEYLFEHQVRPEFTCRIRWEKGTLTLWDNRCAQHLPLNDYQGYRRLMHRVALA